MAMVDEEKLTGVPLPHSVQCEGGTPDAGPCSNSPVGETSYCGEHGEWFAADLKVLELIATHLRQDVRQFWVRSNFYMVVDAALLSVFFSSLANGPADIRPEMFLCTLGLVFTGFWFLVARRSVQFIDRWRTEAIYMDKIVDRHQCYSRVETVAHCNKWTSPSWITQWLPFVFGVTWIGLAYSAIVG